MAEKTRSAQRRLNRSEEEQIQRIPSVVNSEESPKRGLLRKLPSENLEQSSRKSTSFITSTPRLRAMSERLVQMGRRKSENYLTFKPSLDGQTNIQTRSLLWSCECKFKCPTCYKKFRYIGNLKSHISVVHKMVYKDPKTSPVLITRTNQSRQKSYECQLCFKKFKYSSNLKTHRKVHSNLN